MRSRICSIKKNVCRLMSVIMTCVITISLCQTVSVFGETNAADYEPKNVMVTPIASQTLEDESTAYGAVVSWINPAAALSNVSLYILKDGNYELLSGELSTVGNEVVSFEHFEVVDRGTLRRFKIEFEFVDGNSREIYIEGLLTNISKSIHFKANLKSYGSTVNFSKYSAVVKHADSGNTTADNKVFLIQSNESQDDLDTAVRFRIWEQTADNYNIAAGKYTVTFRALSNDDFVLNIREANVLRGNVAVSASEEWKEYTQTVDTKATGNNFRLEPVRLQGEVMIDDIKITNAAGEVIFDENFEDEYIADPTTDVVFKNTIINADSLHVSWISPVWENSSNYRRYQRIYEKIGGELYLRSRIYASSEYVAIACFSAGNHELVIQGEIYPWDIMGNGPAYLSKGSTATLNFPDYSASKYKFYAGTTELAQAGSNITKVKVSVTNTGDAATSPVLFVAGYKNNMLTSLSQSGNLTIDPGKTARIICDGINLENADEAKIIIWSSVNGQTPLKTVEEISLNN